MTERAPIMNRVRRDAVRHVIRADEAVDDYGLDGRADGPPKPPPVTLPPVPWLKKDLPFWNDDTAFAAALTERRRAAREPQNHELTD
jgi:hypothetical protein